MNYGYARVSTDGQSVDAQVKQLRAAGAEKVFRETASARGLTALGSPIAIRLEKAHRYALENMSIGTREWTYRSSST